MKGWKSGCLVGWFEAGWLEGSEDAPRQAEDAPRQAADAPLARTNKQTNEQIKNDKRTNTKTNK